MIKDNDKRKRNQTKRPGKEEEEKKLTGL